MKTKNLRIVIVSMMLLTSVISSKAQDAKSQSPELYVETMHTGKVSRTTASSDGKLLASVSSDGTVKLWDVASRRELRTWRVKQDGLLKFSPNGKILAITEGGNKILIFSMDDETQLEIVTAEAVNEILFTPDSKSIISFGGTVLRSEQKIWSVIDGKEVRLTDRFGSYELYTCSPDGKILVTSGANDKGYKVWDGISKKELTQFRRLNIDLRRIQISPDGKILVAEMAEISGDNSNIEIRDLQKARLISQKTCGYWCNFELSPDSKYLFVYDHSNHKDEAKLLNLSSGKETSLKQILRFNKKGLKDEESVSLYNELSSDRELFKSWYLERMAGSTIKELEMKRDAYYDFKPIIAYEPSKNLLAFSCEDCNELKIIDVTTKKELKIKLVETTRKSLAQRVNSMNFVPGTSILIVRDEVASSRVMVWKIERSHTTILAKALNKNFFLEGFSGETDSAIISPDNKYIACSTAGKIYVLDVESSTKVMVLDREGSPMWFSHDSKTLIINSLTNILLLNITNGKVVPLEGDDPTKEFNHIAFDSDGRLLAGIKQVMNEIEIPSADKQSVVYETIGLWDISNGKELRHIQTHSRSIDSIAFSKDERILASMSSGYDNNLIELWDVESGKLIKSLSANDPSVKQEITNLVPALYENTHSNDANGRSKAYVATLAENGKIQIVKSNTNAVTATLILGYTGGGWVVSTPSGFFDTSFKLEFSTGLHWKFPKELLKPYPLEIFMRDYYEPRLLPRILKGDKLPDQPSIAELNRVQPKVEKITVTPDVGKPNSVNVTVKVSSVSGQCLEKKLIPCESGVYDLRLFRDGQLVQQSPAVEAPPFSLAGGNWREKLQLWRGLSQVKDKDGRPITAATGPREIIFTDIRLPSRADVTQVSFTAYAFNTDRVKSATSEPVTYEIEKPHERTKRRAYVITVGVDATSTENIRLAFAPNSARDVGSILTKRLALDYDEVLPIQLISEYKTGTGELLQDLATKENIQAVLGVISGHGTEAQKLAFPSLSAATPDDLVVLYIASHGYADPVGKFYVIPSDIGDATDVSEEKLSACAKNLGPPEECAIDRDFLNHAISSDELTRWLRAVDAGQMVLVLDSCHAAAVSEPDFKPGPMGDAGFGQLSYDKRMLVLAATQSENAAWGTPALGDRSLLTHALTDQQARIGQPFDLRQWLSKAAELVPDLYRQNVVSSQQQQEPVLFDFSEQRRSESEQ